MSMTITNENGRNNLPPEQSIVILKGLQKHCCMMAREEEDADKELWRNRELAVADGINAINNLWELALALDAEYL